MKKVINTAQELDPAEIPEQDEQELVHQVCELIETDLNDQNRYDIEELESDTMSDLVVHCPNCDIYVSLFFRPAPATQKPQYARVSITSRICGTRGPYPLEIMTSRQLEDILYDIEHVVSCLRFLDGRGIVYPQKES